MKSIQEKARLAGEEFFASNRAATSEQRDAHRVKAEALIEQIRRARADLARMSKS
ncbi:MAG: hypothetical protein H0W74_13695 [Sphingosinicella sp.]|nr:hypothetical protein [Sphingosinicella sp.]